MNSRKWISNDEECLLFIFTAYSLFQIITCSSTAQKEKYIPILNSSNLADTMNHSHS